MQLQCNALIRARITILFGGGHFLRQRNDLTSLHFKFCYMICLLYGQMIDWKEVDGQSDLKSSLQLQRLFSPWRHSAGLMCTPPSSAPLVRARQCLWCFPFLGCIADAASQGDPSTAEGAIASYKAPPSQSTIRVPLRSHHQLYKVSFVCCKLPFLLWRSTLKSCEPDQL